MNQPAQSSIGDSGPPAPGAGVPGGARQARARFKSLGICLVLLLILFSGPLVALVRFALRSELYSHLLLVPFISFYLIFVLRQELAHSELENSRSGALATAILALIPLVLWWFSTSGQGTTAPTQNSLFFAGTSFLLFSIAAGLWWLGRRLVSKIAFPLGILFLSVPFPTRFEHGLEAFFQHASADFAGFLFQVSGTPVVRENLLFHLPHISLEVARECSGIRSSIVLFITSLAAGCLFLRSPWRRGILAAAVIPLAIIRNSLRIFTIGMLCVHIDPSMIHSWVHLKGGPLFFVLSLVPFFALLLWLRAAEKDGILSPEAARMTGSDHPPARPR